MTARCGRPLIPAGPPAPADDPVQVAIALLVHAAGVHEDRGNPVLARSHLARAQALARIRALEQTPGRLHRT